MAISGFVPAWMKISSSDKSNGSPKLNIEQLNNKNRLFQKDLTLTGRTHNKSENVSLFPSSRSSSRDQLLKSSGTDTDVNDVSTKPNERRLNSLSSLNHRSNIVNGNPSKGLASETPFDRVEIDFPTLNGRELSSDHRDQSAIWKDASSKFRFSPNEYSSFKHYDRSFESSRQAPRRARLLSTPSTLPINTQPIIHELQTNCITQTKNLDKRSDFFNSLKNDLTIAGDTAAECDDSVSSDFYSRTNNKNKHRPLLLLSVSETSEEKELLRRMGWNEDVTYEITNEDEEEYTKRMKLVSKTYDRSAVLMLALNRRALPCINIRDILASDMMEPTSDDDNSDD